MSRTVRPSLATTRAVWAAISAQPRSTARSVAATVGCATSTAWHALQALEAAGYIAYLTTGHWRVIVPLRGTTNGHHLPPALRAADQ